MTGFSSLSKGLSGVLFLGYLVPLLFPWTINYLALVPAKTIPFVWNIITAGYIEQSLFGLIVSIFGILFSGKLLEPAWTSREFLKFIIFVNTFTLAGVYATAIISFYVKGRESYLYVPLSGFHGVLSGFLVGFKQAMPNEEITRLGSFQLTTEWLPSLLVLLTIILSFITLESMQYLPFVLFGMYGSWLYIRYLQRNPATNFVGNPEDEFAFSTFFPPFIRPVVDILSSILDKLLCKKRTSRRGDDGLSDISSVPSVDSAEASRWRQRGARALDERLQVARNKDGTSDDPATSIV